MEIRLKKNSKPFKIPEVIVAGDFLKFRGLMFRGKNTAPNLLFKFNNPSALHSFFVFFDFLVIWLDDKNNVLDYRIIKPFHFYEFSKTNFSKIIEIPLNNKNKKLVADFFKFVVQNSSRRGKI
jgi:uncharacterized membrane protein (UPF0127 family)